MSAGSTVAIGIPADVEIARALLARGRRIATSLGIGWIALLILTPSLGARDVEPLSDLASALGGEMRCEEATDIAGALIDLSCREKARVLVIGSSRRPRLLRRLVRGTTERILRAKRPFDVIVAQGEMVDR